MLYRIRVYFIILTQSNMKSYLYLIYSHNINIRSWIFNGLHSYKHNEKLVNSGNEKSLQLTVSG